MSTLGITGAIPLWIVILVVSRDFMIVGAIILSWLVGQAGRDQAAHRLQAQHRRRRSSSPAWCWPRSAFSFDAEPVLTLVMALVAVLTLLSVGLYLAEWVRHMNSAEAGPLMPTHAVRRRGALR